MLWRLSRRAPPAGFILPCQPLLVPKPPTGLGWLHEVKHDGYRIIARKNGIRGVHVYTAAEDRGGVCSLAAESALIDGEAVAVRPNGHSDFAALRTKAGSARACFVAFDLLNLNGEDFRQRPIEQRRAALSPLVAGVHRILFSDALVAEGALVFGRACELGLEGIVSKRAGSRYFEREQSAMAEVKEPSLCVGIAVAAPRGARSGGSFSWPYRRRVPRCPDHAIAFRQPNARAIPVPLDEDHALGLEGTPPLSLPALREAQAAGARPCARMRRP